MPRDLVQVLRELKRALTIPVLVNDRLDVALAGGADGVHLGPGDVPLDLARMVAPRGFLIGASVGADEEGVLSHDADYWGIGPYHHTGTKSDAGTALEAEGLRRIIAQAPAGKPCIAIGGVEPGDIPEIRMCGAVGAAVVSGILRSADITSATRAYAAAWPE
jgi:thiamine-phosphate pyrophosphorylase